MALGGEFFTALPPAGGDDGTPSASAHALSEPMGLSTTTGIGLKGALGHGVLLEKPRGLMLTDRHIRIGRKQGQRQTTAVFHRLGYLIAFLSQSREAS